MDGDFNNFQVMQWPVTQTKAELYTEKKNTFMEFFFNSFLI